MIVSQQRGNLYEDAGLLSTCTSYSQSSDGDAKLSDSQLEVSLTEPCTLRRYSTRKRRGREVVEDENVVPHSEFYGRCIDDVGCY